MRARRGLGFVGLLFGVTGMLGGCGGGAATAASPTSAASVSAADDDSDELAADLNEHHRHHHHGGVTMFIAMSLDSLGVSPEQKAAIEKIQSDLYAKMEPARAAEQNLANVIADGIAAGGADAAKVNAAVSDVATAAAGIHEATIDALNQLHDKLTPDQRVALMDKVAAGARPEPRRKGLGVRAEPPRASGQGDRPDSGSDREGAGDLRHGHEVGAGEARPCPGRYARPRAHGRIRRGDVRRKITRSPRRGPRPDGRVRGATHGRALPGGRPRAEPGPEGPAVGNPQGTRPAR